jgi:hypothetical protein
MPRARTDSPPGLEAFFDHASSLDIHGDARDTFPAAKFSFLTAYDVLSIIRAGKVGIIPFRPARIPTNVTTHRSFNACDATDFRGAYAHRRK